MTARSRKSGPLWRFGSSSNPPLWGLARNRLSGRDSTCPHLTAAPSSSKLFTVTSGLGPRGSGGAPARLLRQTVNPNLFVPTPQQHLQHPQTLPVFFALLPLD